MSRLKRSLALLLCVALTAGSLTACGKKKNKEDSADNNETVATQEETAENAAAEATDNTVSEVKFMKRPTLGKNVQNKLYDASLVPSVPEYSIESDLSNVINAGWSEYWDDDFKNKLSQNGFVVSSGGGMEFFETYEFNSYSQDPNFVTVDSMMHTYHLYFAHLLKNTEKKYLSSSLKTMSSNMLEKSIEQYDECKGSDWEEAAAVNVAYFAIACNLIGCDANVPDYASAMVNEELGKIMDASDIAESCITALLEDYSQYKPRGYYESDPQLEKYFRTMMWYGRTPFASDDDGLTKSAILMTMALDKAASKEWESIYSVTSFFAGASDDYGYCEYLPIIEASYGKIPECADVIGNDKALDSFNSLISKLDPPQIQSIPVYEDEDNVIPSFRLMGQRFTIDGNIMQNLIYRAVDESADGKQRLLPDVLDVPAALGSEKAKEIVLDNGADIYPNYEENLDKLRKDISAADESIWTSSLYSGWLSTLTPLLDVKGAGYPKFMQSPEWVKKTLETFAGSYTELKHDTVLYAKQPMAEMGGGDMDEVDDRGYVEPEPLVYVRFAELSQKTAEGLRNYGMIGKEDVEALNLLTELAERLLVISQKELRNELPTDEEFELIRNYGGNIEHFWYLAMKDDAENEYFTSEEFPAALVVDVATDPNGSVLEAGTGNPHQVAVVVPVDGILRIAYGSVYNFYEFEWPLSDRLTDSKWRQMIGAEPGAGYLYETDDSITKPEWTNSYRAEQYVYTYEY